MARLGPLARGLASAAFAVALWQIIVWAGDMKHFILPDPWRVAQAMWSSRVMLAENAVITFAEIIIGFALGVLLGMFTAIQLAASPAAHTLLRPTLVFMQAAPVFALAPILTIWFGFGMASKIVMAAMIIYFPVLSAFLDGLKRTPQGFVDLARCMGASEWRILWHVRMPAAVPSLCSGLRLAAVYTPIGVIIGEWIGSSHGLGRVMLDANARSKVDVMFAAVVILALFTVVMHRVVDWAATWATDKMADPAG